MKPVLALFLLLPVVLLSSCTTLANRRDLFGPPKPQGKYTDLNREIYFGRQKHHGVPR